MTGCGSWDDWDDGIASMHGVLDTAAPPDQKSYEPPLDIGYNMQ